MKFIYYKQSQIRRKLIFFLFSKSLPSDEKVHKMTGLVPRSNRLRETEEEQNMSR